MIEAIFNAGPYLIVPGALVGIIFLIIALTVKENKPNKNDKKNNENEDDDWGWG